MAGFPVDGMGADIPGELPAPTRAEGMLPSEEESYYESVGFPILIDLLSKASAGSQMQPGQPQALNPATTTFEHTRSRDARGRPKPQSRLEAANNLLRAKKARVGNPGIPNLPGVAQVVNQRMAAGPQQMAPQQMAPQRQPAPPRSNQMQQARRPEVYQPLRQQQSASAPPQAFDINKAG